MNTFTSMRYLIKLRAFETSPEGGGHITTVFVCLYWYLASLANGRDYLESELFMITKQPLHSVKSGRNVISRMEHIHCHLPVGGKCTHLPCH